ncbi:MAG: GGDEF domain-containing protein [Cycloclasticus sp.]
MTKIANRRAYEERLIDEINTAKRSTKPLALIMLDVDSFKQYNDYYGHDLGDVVLKRIAQVISESLPRSTDFSGRFGGEEFVVLLPSTDIFGAYQVAEKIRLSIKSLEIKHIKSDVKHVITVSAGIAALSGDSLNDIELFKQADTALYQAKEAGRNKSITFKLSNKDNRSNKL